ncbi:hypothetical protein V8C86DRAFT_2812990 [Haematococcus lacustris]
MAAAPVLRVVEFGSGSGNLVLPLAWALPWVAFHAVDCKPESVQLLLSRAQAAGLRNVTAEVGRIEDYSGACDVALALHACGAATDHALQQAQRTRAAFVVSPCCIGKLGAAGGPGDPLSTPAVPSTLAAGEQQAAGGAPQPLSYPRSRWLRQGLASLPDFLLLAQAGDISHAGAHSHSQLAQLAKTSIELDRAQHMAEAGYLTALTSCVLQQLHPFKSDVIVGVPAEGVAEGRFAWPWRDIGTGAAAAAGEPEQQESQAGERRTRSWEAWLAERAPAALAAEASLREARTYISVSHTMSALRAMPGL